mgnify:FL=1
MSLGAYIAVKVGLGSISKGVNWRQIWGVGCLAGIGFTMSLFVGSLAFTDPALVSQAKLAILIGSGCSAFLGTVLLLSSKSAVK